jgi:predicted ATPase
LAVEVALLRRGVAGSEVSPLAVSAGVLHLILELAEERPLVLAFDDAQWIDAASAQTLAFVLRSTGQSDVTVLSAVRTPHRSAIGHDHGGCATFVALQGLGLEELDELIRIHIGHRLLLPALVQVRRLSDGNPLATLELVGAADARGVDLACEGGGPPRARGAPEVAD